MACPNALPQEILEDICKRTSPRDVGAWRATHREMLLRLDAVFIKLAFETVELPLDQKHLLLLKTIATSRFAAKVKYVHFRPRSTRPRPHLDHEGRLVELIDESVEKEKDFRQSGDDIIWLVQALSGFTNLLGVEIEATTNRALQTRLALTRPKNRLRVVSVRHLSVSDTSHALYIVLLALAKLRIRGQSVKVLRAGALSVGVLQMAMDGNMSAQGLKHLEVIDLALEVPRDYYSGGGAAPLASCLLSTTSAKRLNLSFWHSDEDWLSTTFNKVHLQRLEELRLRAVHRVDFGQLEAFLSRHKSTLRTLELQNVTFSNDALAVLFPAVFTSGELHLSSIKFQQLCSVRKGLLLFGTSLDMVCETCNEDRLATWANEIGPGCEHATLAATGSEILTMEELKRTKEMYTLPWPKRIS